MATSLIDSARNKRDDSHYFHHRLLVIPHLKLIKYEFYR